MIRLLVLAALLWAVPLAAQLEVPAEPTETPTPVQTIAATQAAWSAPRVKHPQIREALDAIADEEGDHALLAWRFVDWMLETRPHLEPIARQTFMEAWEPSESPFAAGISEREREALAHGRVSVALEDRIRRHAFHHIVIPCARALFEKRGSGETITWPERAS